MSWPIASVRGGGRDQAGLARSNVLLLHLVGTGRNLQGRKALRKEKQLSM
jgi:hypothetical protein